MGHHQFEISQGFFEHFTINDNVVQIHQASLTYEAISKMLPELQLVQKAYRETHTSPGVTQRLSFLCLFRYLNLPVATSEVNTTEVFCSLKGLKDINDFR